MDLHKFSYGATSAVITGMTLVTGLDAANTMRLTIVAGLLIFAIADKVTAHCPIPGGGSSDKGNVSSDGKWL